MKVTIVGIENVDYTKKDGTKVSGKNVHYTTPLSNGIGVTVGTEYISSRYIFEDIVLGDYEFFYGKTRTGQAYLSGYNKVK